MVEQGPRFLGEAIFYVDGEKGRKILVGAPDELTSDFRREVEGHDFDFVFISHRDDVAACCELKKEFGAKILIHEKDAHYVQDCQVDIPAKHLQRITPECVLIHTPGHSEGSACLLLERGEGILFTGDTLMGGRDRLVLPPDRFSTDPALVKESVKKLVDYEFDAILPSRGQIVVTDAKRKLTELIRTLR